MASKQYHMSCSIEGLLKNYKGKIEYLTDDDGNPLSDAQARAELARLQALGHKLIPSCNCEGFDPFEKGCPGVKEKVPKCRVCGCTDLDCRQCIKKTGNPCWWVEPDLCSACVIKNSDEKNGI